MASDVTIAARIVQGSASAKTAAAMAILLMMLCSSGPATQAADTANSAADAVPLIPRKQLAYLAPLDGVLNVWVCPADDLKSARAVTHSTHRPIREYSWAYTSQHILYTQDDGGNENFHVHAVDLTADTDKDLTPNPAVRAEIINTSEKFPDEILVGLNDRNPVFHDVHRINIRTGADKLVLQNPQQLGNATIADIMADDDYHIRLAIGTAPDGSQQWFKYTGANDNNAWLPAGTVPPEDALTTSPVGFDKTGKIMYLTDSRGRDTAGVFTLNLATGTETLVADDPRCDAGGILTQPVEKNIQAVSFNYEKQTWKVIDPAVQADFDYLQSLATGELIIISRSQDDSLWTVAIVTDDGPVRYYKYDHKSHQATFLFTNRSRLEKFKLASMHPVIIKSRDGLDLVAYVTLPPDSDLTASGKPDHPLPTVLFVHGGPWARDAWGYNPYHQWLANRGYAVISVNYRGSTGFGKKFINAGNHEWAAKMHDDLIDTVNWAVDQGIAQKDKVAIMGGSYGGYATLVGLTFTPDVFACGVDICGPSNLVTLLKSIPPYWAPQIAVFNTRVGDYHTPEGAKFLESRSPLSFVDKITRPLLIGQGANDPRVKEAEADQIVKAMNQKHIPVTYVLYSDEGHGFARPPNNMSFNAVTEAFLAEHLGGRVQPVGNDFHGSTIAVPSGADQVPGLAPALESFKATTTPAAGKSAPTSQPWIGRP
jgi:dipeptidyl aminopeptidase/acylaminoacyl peptidase